MAAVTYGARRWQTPGGKAATIITSLFVLAAGAGFALLLAKAMEGGNTL